MGPRASTSPFASVVFRAQLERRVLRVSFTIVFASRNRRKEEKERERGRGTRRSRERFGFPSSSAFQCAFLCLFPFAHVPREKTRKTIFKGRSIDRSVEEKKCDPARLSRGKRDDRRSPNQSAHCSCAQLRALGHAGPNRRPRAVVSCSTDSEQLRHRG